MTTISLTPPVRSPQATDASSAQRTPAPAAEEAAKPRNVFYFSPVVRIDPKTEVAVWEVRDPETGQVVQQFPRESSLKAYRAQSADAAAAAAGKEGATKVSPEGSK